MEYYICDDLNWIDATDVGDVKDRHVREIFHELKFITDHEISDFTCYKVPSIVTLVPDKIYTVVYVAYNWDDGSSLVTSNYEMVGIYENFAQAQKVIDEIEQNNVMLPDSVEEFYVDGEIINPASWKDPFSTVSKITAVELPFKHKES